MRHPTALLSDTIGVPESTLRLITTILLAYPVAAGFRYLYANNNASSSSQTTTTTTTTTKEEFTRTVNARNRYMALSGLALAIYFSGWDMYHGLVTMMVSYGLCYVFQQQRQVAVATVWIFNAVYLLTGYYTMASNDYDISWTMPQCILCLRLMGFGMDFMDGEATAATATTKTTVMEEKTTIATTPDDGNEMKHRVAASSTTAAATTTTTTTTTTTVTTTASDSPSSSSSSARPLSFGPNTALTNLPSFLQMVGYCFYPSAFLIGPQFSFSLYQEWLFFFDTQGSTERSKQQYNYVLTCFGWAVGYLALQQLVGSHYPTSYLLTSEYASLSPLHRFGIFWLAGKFVFTKYLGVWLLTEGSTALFGIGYEGKKTSTNNHSFAGLANVDPIKYETATSLEHIIGSFNINTNMWSKYYVFKRLRWMGSKTASQIGTLAFLAIWHGFHYGYFTTFLLEFLDVMAEGILRKWVTFFAAAAGVDGLNGNKSKKWIRHGLAWCLCTSTLFYAGVGFDLLSISSSLVAYRQVYYFGHVGLVTLLVSSFFLPRSSAKVVIKVQQQQKIVKND